MPDTPDTELGTNLFEDLSPKPVAKKGNKKDAAERTWIVLEDSTDVPPTGLSLGVNGEIMTMLPGEPVHIQNKYLEVLDHAIISVPQQNASQQVIGTRQRHRFPYRHATSTEIEAATDKS